MEQRAARRARYPFTIPDALLDNEAMRHACAARDFSTVFRLVNRRTGTSQAEIAAVVGKMTSSRVGDIIRGVRGVRGQAVIERISDGLGIPGVMLGLPERPWESESLDEVHPAAGTKSGDAAKASLGAGGHAERVRKQGAPPTLVDIAELREQVNSLDERYSIEPSTVLVAEMGRSLGQLAHWESGVSSYTLRRDLLAAVAEASTLMGQLVWDASGRTDHATARSYFSRAGSAAQELRDPIAEGLSLLRSSFVTLYGERDPVNGLHVTRRTAETVQGASHALSGLATLHAAEAHAMMRQRSECEKALRQAERHFERASASDAGAPMLSPGQFGRLSGSCYLSLQDAKRAQSILEVTASQVRSGSKSHAIALGNLSLAFIRQRKVDEAVHTLNRAIEIVERHRGGGGINLIFQAGRELQTWRDAHGVRDVNDRLFSLMASA